MAVPTVFVSSTFYDLKYIRENLRRFIAQLGYNPVLSEDGAVFYDPATSAAESCMTEIPNTQLFVLVIGGRFGSTMPNSVQSITNAEYQQAVQQKIPVFAFVEQGTYSDFQLYEHNVGKTSNLNSIIFPNADSVKIFDFIRQVQDRSVNNALCPFRSFDDIESYLRSQWAGMMYSFLTRKAESARVVDSLEILEKISARTELIAAQILRNVGQVIDQLAVDFLQRMLLSQAISDINYVEARPTPIDVVKYETFQDCVTALYGRPFKLTSKEQNTIISQGGEISEERLKSSEADYTSLRDYMRDALAGNSIGLNEFYNYKFTQLKDVTVVLPTATIGVTAPTGSVFSSLDLAAPVAENSENSD